MYTQNYLKIGKVCCKFEELISKPTILRSILNYPSFDKEVLRLIELMPNWIPGENNGKNVIVEYNLPFQFKLN